LKCREGVYGGNDGCSEFIRNGGHIGLGLALVVNALWKTSPNWKSNYWLGG
jgi:hypothetical protein